MHRIIWIGGVACVAQVACIEGHTPAADGDAAVPDASEPEPAPPAGPDPNELDPAVPDPDPDLPPWICPPDGAFQFHLGACVGHASMAPEANRFTATITEIGEGLPAQGPCNAGEFRTTIGRIGSDNARWFNAVTPDGHVWQIVLDLPVEVRFEAGEEVVIDAQLELGFVDEVLGSLAISTDAGLQAFVLAGSFGQPSLDDPELQLGRGDQSCHVEDEDYCAYTGHRLRASAPRANVVHELRYGQIAEVGPFEVINGGVLSIGDLGACNAAPERFNVAAWRRR